MAEVAPEPSQLPLSPTTTVAEDLTHQGQRTINKIWELTQAVIAILVTCAVVYTEVKDIEARVLQTLASLIIGAYFSRTNHASIGGVGPKPQSEYVGR